MMMYLDPDASQAYYEEFVTRMTEFMNAISNREALTLSVEISRDVLQGQYYRALMKCRKLFEFENVRLSYVPAGLSEDTASV
jgi:flagellar protein FlbT